MPSLIKKLPVYKDNAFCYNIVMTSGWNGLLESVKEFDTRSRKACIITDSNVQALYAEEIRAILSPIFSEVFVYAFEAGEDRKNLSTVTEIYHFLANHHFDRQDLLIAAGGGVVGDITGFAAATYMRGVDFIQIPTTLLAQIDSSIGGKTGVDLEGRKNLVGAFHQPCLVYINTDALNTLPDAHFASGMGEIIKHGLLRSESYYRWLNENHSGIARKDPESLREMIFRSCKIKAEIVETDPFEKGPRALLNLGHTLGHAVEKESGFLLPHGACVAIGIAGADYLSNKRDMITRDDLNDIIETLTRFNLPVQAGRIDRKVVLFATKSDKKMRAGQIRFILLDGIGNAVISDDVTDNELLEAIDYITAKA